MEDCSEFGNFVFTLIFKHTITELDATSMEQLDLLIKYLGPSSKKTHAQNIRSANANYPATAVRFICERLDTRFNPYNSVTKYFFHLFFIGLMSQLEQPSGVLELTDRHRFSGVLQLYKTRQ